MTKVCFAVGHFKSARHKTGEVINSMSTYRAIKKSTDIDIEILFPVGFNEDSYFHCQDQKDCEYMYACRGCMPEEKRKVEAFANYVLDQDFDVLLIRDMQLAIDLRSVAVNRNDGRMRILYATPHSSEVPGTLNTDIQALKSVDGFVCFTEDELNYCKSICTTNVPKYVLPMCIDTKRFYHPHGGTLQMMGHAGSFNSYNNISNLISLFPEILNVFPDFGMKISVSEYKGKKVYEEAVVKLGLSDKISIETNPHNMMPKFYSKCDILWYGRCEFVRPQKDRAIGIKILEYMATGKPIIICDNQKYILDNLVGSDYPFVVDTDLSNIVEVLDLIKSHPGTVEYYGKRNLNIAKRFDGKEVAKIAKTIIGDMCGSGQNT